MRREVTRGEHQQMGRARAQQTARQDGGAEPTSASSSTDVPLQNHEAKPLSPIHLFRQEVFPLTPCWTPFSHASVNSIHDISLPPKGRQDPSGSPERFPILRLFAVSCGQLEIELPGQFLGTLATDRGGAGQPQVRFDDDAFLRPTQGHGALAQGILGAVLSAEVASIFVDSRVARSR